MDSIDSNLTKKKKGVPGYFAQENSAGHASSARQTQNFISITDGIDKD